MRVVLDVNVLVSAIISPHGSPGKILNLWEKDQFDLILSPAILDELERVIHYPKIQGKYTLPEEQVKQFIDLISSQSIIVDPSMKINLVRGDPPDNRFLECAREGGATYIVTGDNDLLDLKEYEGIEILLPSVFLAILEIESKKNG